MGFMLLCSRKRSLTSDIMSENPSKKIKLGFQNNENGGNDDLWGQDDVITAEEFDLLEVQATQSCYQNNNLLNNNTLQTNNLLPKASISVEDHDLKQHQYELEGRVKHLSLSLDKITKELKEERLNRERLVSERMKQSHEREVSLKKDVERLQSILEFKEQEMKSTYSKWQMLKSQVKDKKGIDANVTVNSNFEDFLKSSKCDEQFFSHGKKTSERYSRKYKLSVDTPRGQLNGIEILSSLLCSRLSIPSLLNKETTINLGCSADSSSSSSLTPLSVLHLKNEQNCDEILEYYSNFMKSHVNLLKSLASKNNRMTSSKNSVSSKPKEAFCSQTVVCYLTDITYIYSSLCFKSDQQKCNIKTQNLSTSSHVPINEKESFSCLQQNEKAIVSDSTLSLVQSLSALSNIETYPIGYHKNEEMECALSSLLSICLSYPIEFLDLIEELPCYFLSNPYQSVAGLCTTVKLLIALFPNKKFISYLAHKDRNCILCLIADFLHITVPTDPEKFASCLILIEDFLSSMLLVHNYKETLLGSSSCISEVIQGMIKSLWKYFQIREDNILSFKILRKGFLFLHFISSNIPNFKEIRVPVEDEYISLVSGILAVSKENNELKEFYDLIHNLWDFQTDSSEFDLDELSEENHGCTNDIDVE